MRAAMTSEGLVYDVERVVERERVEGATTVCPYRHDVAKRLFTIFQLHH